MVASIHVRKYGTQVKEGNFKGIIKKINRKINPKAGKMFVYEPETEL
jgi:hypothetical protein